MVFLYHDVYFVLMQYNHDQSGFQFHLDWTRCSMVLDQHVSFFRSLAVYVNLVEYIDDLTKTVKNLFNTILMLGLGCDFISYVLGALVKLTFEVGGFVLLILRFCCFHACFTWILKLCWWNINFSRHVCVCWFVPLDLKPEAAWMKPIKH